MARSSTTASRRYAEAVFQLAARDDALDAYADGLGQAVQMLGGEAARDIVGNPARALRARLDFVNGMLQGRVPEPVLKLVGLLVQRGRIDQLPRVAAEYQRLLNARQGVVEALATSASPLTADETAALQRKLAEMTGRIVDLRVDVDPALIGGLTVRVGDTLYDASVRGRLERLRERLVAGAA